MCGISGVFGNQPGDQLKDAVARMNDALAHRGPDAQGIYAGEGVVLGHRRLSIIDLAAHANQPMHSADGRYVLVFNGELYNYRELRGQLADHTFRTDSDTEVVLAAWQKWGAKCLLRFNGMFAFAVWDSHEQELFLVRDRLGIKPLYITRQGQQWVFASEIRALLASGLVPARMDRTALIDYLRYQTVHAPKTMLEGVELVPPATVIRIQDNETTSTIYWSPETHWSREAQYAEPAAIRKAIREKLRASVELRMRADVPFGAFLSGGIDSSAIVGLMAEVSDHPVQTFSVTFDEEAFNEGAYAQMVADKFNTRHTDIRLRPDDFLEAIPNALAAMDHPSGDGPNTYTVSKVTKEAGVTMALSGLGGDELFAGYPVFKRMVQIRSRKWLTSFPRFMKNAVGQGLRTLKPGVASDKIHQVLVSEYLDFEYVYPLERQVLLDPTISKLVGAGKLPVSAVRRLLEDRIVHGTAGFDLPVLSKVSVAEMASYMQHVLLRDSDQMSMAHALEVRVPFLDHNLVEYAMGIPDLEKFPQTPKQLLIESLDGLLPEAVYNRPKMGFTFPWEVWMKEALRPLCTGHLKRLGEREPFKGQVLDQLWTRFEKGDPRVKWSHLWPLVVLEDWLERHGVQ